MSLRDPQITIIMACHNSSAYLHEAVNSVLGQTLNDLELILVDDCSTDDTIGIARQYESSDERVSVISLSTNCTPAAARNVGIRAAKGEWLGILDSDDVAVSSRFEEQLSVANSDNKLVMIGSGSVSIDQHSQVIKEHRYPTKHQELVKRLYSLRAFPPHSSVIYRRDAVHKVSAFNPRYVASEDYDLFLRLSESGEIACVDKPLVKIRKHGQNRSNPEAGLLQHNLGNIACICHFLRISGFPDPSTGDEEAWLAFVGWVQSQVSGEDEFTKSKVWSEGRAKYFGVQNRWVGAFRFGMHILQSGHSRSLVHEKLFGSSRPERLAREWMKRSLRKTSKASS